MGLGRPTTRLGAVRRQPRLTTGSLLDGSPIGLRSQSFEKETQMSVAIVAPDQEQGDISVAGDLLVVRATTFNVPQAAEILRDTEPSHRRGKAEMLLELG